MKITSAFIGFRADSKLRERRCGDGSSPRFHFLSVKTGDKLSPPLILNPSCIGLGSKQLFFSTACALILSVLTGCSKHNAPAAPTKSSPKPVELEQAPPPPGINVFNSYDAHNHFDKATAWAVMNDSQSGYRGQAEWFVPTGSGQLNLVDLALRGQGAINVTVTEDKNGLPGKPVESFLNIPGSHFDKAGHCSLISVAHPVLNAGVKYWLCAEPAGSGSGCSWAYNNQNLAQGFAYERGPGSGHFSEAALATALSASVLFRSADIPVCGFWRLSSRQFPNGNTGLEAEARPAVPVNPQTGMSALRQ